MGRVASRARASSLPRSRLRAVRFFAVLGQRAYPLHQVEQVWVLLADQRFAEQSDHAPHVGPQRGVVGSRACGLRELGRLCLLARLGPQPAAWWSRGNCLAVVAVGCCRQVTNDRQRPAKNLGRSTSVLQSSR